MLDFGHGDLAAGRDHRVEVARRHPVDEVAGLVALPRLDDRHVGVDGLLQHVRLAVERPRVLVLGQHRAEAGARVEAGDAGAAGAQLLGQRALRRQLQLQFAGQHLALEFLVLAHVAGDDLLHLARLEQQPHAEIVDAGVVADDGEVLGAAGDQRTDQVLRNAAQTEPAGGDRHAVVQQTLQRVARAGIDFSHGSPEFGRIGVECSLPRILPGCRPARLRQDRAADQRDVLAQRIGLAGEARRRLDPLHGIARCDAGPAAIARPATARCGWRHRAQQRQLAVPAIDRASGRANAETAGT